MFGCFSHVAAEIELGAARGFEIDKKPVS